MRLEKSTKPIIYLKGINFSELEPIIQFIYLGEATFYEDRLNEVLDVGRSLEIRELGKAQTGTNDKSSTNDVLTTTGNSEEQIMKLKRPYLLEG